MKGQWNLIFALVFALIVAIFSVINVEAVKVRYLFGEAFIPLIIVILASTLAGGLIVGAMGLFRQFKLQKEIKALRQTVNANLGPEALKAIDKEVDEDVAKVVTTDVTKDVTNDVDQTIAEPREQTEHTNGMEDKK